ncbi:hypothetical protein D3C85_716930 [compost metagenome]
MPGFRPLPGDRVMRARPRRVWGSTSGVTMRIVPEVAAPSLEVMVAVWPARRAGSSVSGTWASSSRRPSRTMRNSSVPAATIWPLVTLRLMIRPETGARISLWARRVRVSDNEARAEARLAWEAR